MLKDKILDLRNRILAEIKAVKTPGGLFEIAKKNLGRKSEFNQILKSLANLTEQEKKEVGELANSAKREITKLIEQRKAEFSKSDIQREEKFDMTLPGKLIPIGHLNPISIVLNKIEDIFTMMGFEIADGPEIETEYYNFDALNMPESHPAREMQDTFWLKQKLNGKDNLAMRSQTSAVQVKYMERHKPPFRIIVPGKCFRRDATDATHEQTFYQFEALVVGDNVNVGNLKNIAEQFFTAFFETPVKVRLRPSYFPFTEPGFEFDISCLVCGGSGCSVCKKTGWLELGGAGMVAQNVFVSAGYPRNRYQGFAWGFGLERLAMMKYKIDDIRLFHSGDLRFIRQF